MVKLVCDRCGKECNRIYHTISISTHDMEPTFVSCYAAEVALMKADYSPFAEINRTPHYCSDCKVAFDDFLKGDVNHV